MKQFQSILFFILLITNTSSGQNFNPSARTDTVRLGDIKLKKVVAYKINSATILVDYGDFMKSFMPFWKKYKKGVQSLNKGKENAMQENPSYTKRFLFLDSIYKILTAQIKTSDTVSIDQLSFSFADIGTGYIFSEKIEAGNCIILDKNNIQQTIILRQKYSYQRGPLDGWGGNLYFIIGEQKAFIRKTDWVS